MVKNQDNPHHFQAMLPLSFLLFADIKSDDQHYHYQTDSLVIPDGGSMTTDAEEGSMQDL